MYLKFDIYLLWDLINLYLIILNGKNNFRLKHIKNSLKKWSWLDTSLILRNLLYFYKINSFC